jgi:hypothetical protein
MNRLKCRGCGKEIEGGHYNTPCGVYCCECWDKTPKEVKELSETVSMQLLAAFGGMFEGQKTDI